MFRNILTAIAVLFALATPSWAGNGIGFPGYLLGNQTTSVAYTGPGDVVTSGWYSYPCLTRAFSHSTVGNSCVTIERTSDNTQCTLVTNNGSGTAQSPFGGLAVDVGTPCNSNTQTAVQFCASTTCWAVTAFDQSGQGHGNWAGLSTRILALTFNCNGSLPCWSGSNNSTISLTPVINATISSATIGQPWTEFVVWDESNASVSTEPMQDNGGHDFIEANNSGSITANAGTLCTSSGTWSINTWYDTSFNGNSSSSIITFRGFQTTGLSCGSNALPSSGNANPGVRAYSPTSSTGITSIEEAGIFNTSLSTGSAGAACLLHDNEKTYYGTAGGGTTC